MTWMSGRRRAALVLGAWAVLALGGGSWADPDVPVDPGPTELGTRAYTIHHKELQDVVMLVQPLLSPEGSLLIQPRLETFTVRDRPDVLEAVTELVAGFDTPPRSVRLEVRLIRASDEEGSTSTEASELGGVVQQLKGFVRWPRYDVLASMEIWTSEGERASLSLSTSYQLDLSVDRVLDRQQLVRLEDFRLQRLTERDDGSVARKPVWDTVVNLRNGQQHVFGATRAESHRKAIFLTIVATVED